MMTVKYVVTFEFDNAPPLVHRGIASGSKAPAVVKRALQAAMRAHPQKSWSSLVICLLERVAEQPQANQVENAPVSVPEA
jgi:hypothetical protein